MKNEELCGWNEHGEPQYGAVRDNLATRAELWAKLFFAFTIGGLTTQFSGCGLEEEAAPELVSGIAALFGVAVTFVLFAGGFAIGVDAVRAWQQRKLAKQS